MTQAVTVHFDVDLDVVSARLAAAKVVRARPSACDVDLIFELDAQGHIVGLEVMGATRLRPSVWVTHPARRELPAALADGFDQWLAALRTQL